MSVQSFQTSVKSRIRTAILAVLFIPATLPMQSLQAYTLPDTGQTKCYGNTGEIACPSPGERFYGQDAQYRGAQLSYRDNGDGTVTDLNTGLIWQQGDDQNNQSRNWQQAVDYCAGLDLAGRTDWRLPGRLELLSLVNYAIPYPGPTIDTHYFPNCRSSNYWSGSTCAYYPDFAWGVGFNVGGAHWSGKTTNYYVRCVRGGP